MKMIKSKKDLCQKIQYFSYIYLIIPWVSNKKLVMVNLLKDMPLLIKNKLQVNKHPFSIPLIHLFMPELYYLVKIHLQIGLNLVWWLKLIVN